MIFSVFYLVVRCLLGSLMVLTRREASKDAELLVLRHENAVLRRQISGVCYQPGDRLLIVNEHHPRQVLTEYLQHYNTARPHRALGQLAPAQAGTRPQVINLAEHRIRRNKSSADSRMSTRSPPNRPRLLREGPGHCHDRLFEPNTIIVPNLPSLTGDWIISTQNIDPAGRPFNVNSVSVCQGNTPQACNNTLSSLHLKAVIDYQPASRF